MLKPVLLLMALSLASGCSDGCANTLVDSKGAPGGRHNAVVFERNCGATTGFSTHVSVVAAGEGLKGAGNAFVADGDHGAVGALGPRVDISWISSRRLRVRYDARARVFRHNQLVEGVEINFEPVER